jgi:hypothetical protein
MNWSDCRFSFDSFIYMACCLAVQWWWVSSSILDTRFSMNLSECYYSYENFSVCRCPLFVLYCRVIKFILKCFCTKTWSTHTIYTVLILSVTHTHTHTYHFFHSWTRIHYLHHKFHVLMNCSHTYVICVP